MVTVCCAVCCAATCIQDELDREISCMLVAAESDTDNALGYIVGWLIAGELQVRLHP